MKTATVTWITYNNYGTVLQAYAFQRYVFSLGLSNDIIYDKIILRSKKPLNTVKPTFGGRIKRVIKHPFKFLKVFNQKLIRKLKKTDVFYDSTINKIEEFKKNELTLKYLQDLDNLTKLNEEYDAFFCGSDQIWSVLQYNFKGYYYLDFANKPKIAYAPSIGTDNISKEKAEQIKEYLKDFTAISVRESSSAKILNELTGQDVTHVCDPTLLFGKEFWGEFADGVKNKKNNYLFCYFLEDKPWYYEYAKKLAKVKKLKLVVIPNTYRNRWQKCTVKGGVGPKEFVSLIKNAAFVLTDSYHGSLFALNFNKQFIYLKRFKDDQENNQNIRIFSLFDKLGLNSLIVEEKEFSVNDVKEINYDEVNKIIGTFRNDSKDYLNKAIGKVK